MKICIYGAGAVGGHLAVRLAVAGHAEVSVVARGAHLAAIRQRGLVLRNDAGEQWHATIHTATDQPDTLPPQDVVLVTLKACALPSHAQTLARLLAPGGVVVFLNNGIPWWWTAAEPGGGHSLPLLDPQGQLWDGLGVERSIGAVVYSPNEIESPGVVVNRSKSRNRFVLGLPRSGNADQADKLRQTVQLFQDSGLPAEIAADLRQEIWQKLLVNAGGNPISALTRLGTVERNQDAELRQLSLAVATEIAAVAQSLGWVLSTDTITEAVGAGKAQSMRPSMLQDALAGRPMEIEALLGQPQAFARARGVLTPRIDVLVCLLRGLDRSNATAA